MNKFLTILIAALCLYTTPVCAQSINDYDVKELDYIPVSDSEFDWSQFNEKKIKAVLNKKGLQLESKSDELCVSTCELPINMDSDDFMVALKMVPESVDDKIPFGIVYDYKNDANFKMLLIKKKSFELVEVEKGATSIIKKGLYKGKDKEFTVSITRNKNKLFFGINGINVTTQLNTKLEYPVFGFVLASKGKLIGKSMAYKKIQARDTEEL